MFATQNEACVYLAKGKEVGNFKNCVHLTVIGGSFDGNLRCSPFELFCQKHSLIPGHPLGFQDRCPEPCLLFKDKDAVERAKRRATLWQSIKGKSYVPFRYFAKLPATTQALILLLLLSLVLPRSLKTVLEIWKAVK